MTYNDEVINSVMKSYKNGVSIKVISELNAIPEDRVKQIIASRDSAISSQLQSQIDEYAEELLQDGVDAFRVESFVRQKFDKELKDVMTLYIAPLEKVLAEGTKRKRRTWSLDIKEKTAQLIADGVSPSQAVIILKIPEADKASYKQMYNTMKCRGSAQVLKAKKSSKPELKRDVAEYAESRERSTMEDTEVQEIERKQKDSAKAGVLGGTDKCDTISVDSTYHEYVSKVKMLESLIEIKKRELASIRALREEYIKLCNLIKETR